MKVITPLVFNPFEFSRSSEAAYYDSAGLIAIAEIDELRFGYDPTTLDFIGPIIEDAAKNCLLKSNEFTEDTVWIPSTVDIFAHYYSPGSTNNPAGGSDVSSIENSNFGTAYLEQTVSNSEFSTGTACFSVYMKAGTLGGAITVRLQIQSSVTTEEVFTITPGSSSSTEDNGYKQKLPNDWYRLSVYGPVVNSGTTKVRIGFSGPREHYVYGAQFEMSSTGAPSSIIYTDDVTVTRAADIEVSQSPSLVSSNVEEDDAPLWDDDELYTEGQEVMVLGQYHKTYIALRSTVNEFPPDNLVSTGVDSNGLPIPPAWILQGSTNRWRMFDMVTGIERQTVATDSDGTIRVIIAIDGAIDSFALFNISGTHVSVYHRDGDGNTVYSLEQDLLTEPDEIGWWAWFWGNRTNIDTIVRTDLPPFAPCTLEVIIEGGDEIAALGKLVIGDATDIGCVRFGVSGGIVDFSRKDRDTFGNSTVIPRRYIDRCEYDILLDTDDVSRVKKLLTELRATPAAYIGSEEDKYAMTSVFGFYRDFNIVIAGPVKSACALQVESI